MCVLCSCMFCIIIIGLSIGLGNASRNDSLEAPDQETILITKTPTYSPTITPTASPEDFNWCYESNETEPLNNTRYTSIRSVLISSEISTGAEFSEDASYQRKSLCWLAFGDRLQLDAFDPFIEQRYALATIYYSFEDSSLLSRGWLSGKPECEWKPMIVCDSRTDTTVVRLDLPGDNLVGTLPKEMGVLKDVTYIDLTFNLLSGDVSEAIGGWTNLAELKLSGNNFESLPSSLRNWNTLKHLDFAFNNVGGPIPARLVLLSQLAYLDLSANKFNGPIPTEFGQMTSLEKLYMHANELEGSMPDAICKLRSGNLERLSADCHSVGGSGTEVECEVNKQLTGCCTSCGKKLEFDVSG